jgi:hypothetical protein
MTAGYEVEPGSVEGHAGSLDVVADELSAVAAGMPDALGDQPLGAFAQFLVTGLQTAMGQTTAAITHAVSTSDEMSTGLRRAAADYRLVEDRNAATFTREDTP